MCPACRDGQMFITEPRLSTTAPPPQHPRPAPSPLARLDDFMAAHPFHPRLVPFAVYLIFLSGISIGVEQSLYLYPVLYAVQCIVVGWLVWRYRKLTPEVTLSFHWSVIPSAVFVLAMWLGLGMLMIRLAPSWFESTEPHTFEKMRGLSPWLFYVSFSMRLLGMSLVVPLIEEVFNRSLLLRCTHSARASWVGFLQVMQDMPLVGEWFMETEAARRAAAQPGQFKAQFDATALGVLSVFAVVVSSLMFMMVHATRDKPAAFLTGVTWCLMLAWTRRKGLGPIMWSHGLTNAMLWAWTLYTNDWRFL